MSGRESDESSDMRAKRKEDSFLQPGLGVCGQSRDRVCEGGR